MEEGSWFQLPDLLEKRSEVVLGVLGISALLLNKQAKQIVDHVFSTRGSFVLELPLSRMEARQATRKTRDSLGTNSVIVESLLKNKETRSKGGGLEFL